MYNAPTMSIINPVLDQPQSFDYELLPAAAVNWLANQDLYCWVDANSATAALADDSPRGMLDTSHAQLANAAIRHPERTRVLDLARMGLSPRWCAMRQ